MRHIWLEFNHEAPCQFRLVAGLSDFFVIPSACKVLTAIFQLKGLDPIPAEIPQQNLCPNPLTQQAPYAEAAPLDGGERLAGLGSDGCAGLRAVRSGAEEVWRMLAQRRSGNHKPVSFNRKASNPQSWRTFKSDSGPGRSLFLAAASTLGIASSTLLV